MQNKNTVYPFPSKHLVKRKVKVAPDCTSDLSVQQLVSKIKNAGPLNICEILKDDHASAVFKVKENSRYFIVKKYLFHSWLKVLRRLLRPSRASYAWKASLILSKCGISSFQPLALIEERRYFLLFSSTFLCSYIPGLDARTFFDTSHVDDQQTYLTAEEIVQTIKRLHSCNLIFWDTKHTNILIDQKKVYLVDLDAVRRFPVPYIRTILQARDWRILVLNWRQKPEIRDMFVDILRNSLKKKDFALLASILIRCGKFMETIPEKRKALPPELRDSREIKSIAENFLQYQEHPDWQKVKSAGTSIVASKKNAPAFYLKIFLPRSSWEPLKKFIRGGRGFRALQNTTLLKVYGFKAPEIVCYNSINGRELIVMEEIPGLSLESYIRDKSLKGKNDLIEHRKILRRLGQEIGRMHNLGIIHGDLRLSNILVDMVPEKPEFYFLDNEGTRLYSRSVPERLRVKNLAQLNMEPYRLLSGLDRMRFFVHYQRAAGLPADEAKKLMNKVERRTLRRLKENLGQEFT